MLCETCKNNPATIHTADIVNNVKSEKHVCEACYKKGDMLVCISSSGNSANVVNAASFVKEEGGDVYAFTGFDAGNKLNEITGEHNFWVDSKAYNVVESIHNLWLAMICDVLAEWMGEKAGLHGIKI